MGEPSPTLLADVLTKAAQLIEPDNAFSRGWTARRLVKPTEPDLGDCCCLADDPHARESGAKGAICKIGKTVGLSSQEIYALGRRVATSVGARYLTDWSGERSRPKSEIIAAFNAVAADLNPLLKATEGAGTND